MELIKWSEKYSVNNFLLDSQHKKLIAIINELHTAMKVARGNEIMQTIFDELIWYTKEHFRTEEQIMQKFNYPAFKEHKAEHEELTEKVLKLQKDYKEGKSLITMDTMNFLKSWLINHIEGTDKKYKDKIIGNSLNQKILI
ncbi:MAG: bacteriohemerythrin [Ignavibacteriaceae bacterium]